MAGGALDGAGRSKVDTLEDAGIMLQRVHGMVERYALAVKQQAPTGPMLIQIRRGLEPMAGVLKAQFGLVSDQVTGLILVMGRGGSDITRIRSLREGVAQLRTALEIAERKVREQHTKDVELSPE